MSLLMPCTTPVTHALPNTGLFDTWLVAGAGGLVVMGGIAAVVMAKTLKGKLTALALPVFAVAGLALGNPQPSLADTGAPTVTTQIAVGSSGPDGDRNDTISLQTDAAFNNPENCGTLTYQWEIQANYNGPWAEMGAATTAFVPFVAHDCDYKYGRVKVTLTNRSGAVSTTSNDSWLCD